MRLLPDGVQVPATWSDKDIHPATMRGTEKTYQSPIPVGCTAIRTGDAKDITVEDEQKKKKKI